jgi:DNA-binding transcriptional LysR family regulator
MIDPPESSITLRRLRLVLALAEEGGVTAAAKALGMSQPALSQNLRVIEAHYGFPFLMRSGRRTVLTNPGRLVVEYARRILRLVDESERAIGDLLQLRRGRLSLGASTTPGTYLLPRVLAEFRVRHPDVDLQLRIGDTRDVERWVLAGAVDLGVIGETAEQLGLSVTPFRRDELVVVAPLSHPLSAVLRVDGEVLAAQPLIVRETGSSTRETLERALRSVGQALNVQFELGSTEAILQAVAAGLGASVVSELAVAEPAVGRRLRVRRVAGLDLSRYLAVVTHPDAEPGPAAREFVLLLERGVAPPTIPAA